MNNSFFYNWQTTDDECERFYPCDELLTDFDDDYFRSITVFSAKEILFRWLCQLKVAPYSYDWIDNFGYKSPETLSPEAAFLMTGDSFMTIFELVEWKPNHSITLQLKPNSRSEKLFGKIVMTYFIATQHLNEQRLTIKIRIKYPPGFYGFLVRQFLPFGDWIMMRKQLITLKKYSESSQPTLLPS